jgi:hypothetical protein
MLTDLQEKDILLLYKSGKTLRNIQETTGYSQATIMRVAKKNKAKKRGEHCLRINRAKLKNLPEDYLSRQFTIKDLMKKYKVKSEQTLYRILDEMQVPRQRVVIKPVIGEGLKK